MRMPWSKKRYPATFRKEVVEYNGVGYSIREITVAERAAWLAFVQENEASALLCCASIVSLACDEFAGDRPEVLAVEVAPKCLDFLCGEICRLNEIGAKAAENLEKKSENSPS